MAEYEFYQVSYKHFKTENEDGSGKLLILDNKTKKCKSDDTTAAAVKVRDLYRSLKRELA